MNLYLWINETQAGPYSLDQVEALLADQNITLETLYWKEGLADWQTLDTLLFVPPAKPVDQVTFTTSEDSSPRLFSGFWRRAAAYVVDIIILQLFGYLLGTVFFNFFCSLGSLSLLVGLGICLLYFGIQDSAVCGGQTLGKRLMRIAVVNEVGESLSVAQAMLRYALFGIPPLGCKWVALGAYITSVSGFLFGAILVGWIVISCYLVTCNRPSRQGLHDLILHTFVVRTLAKGPVISAPLWGGHLVIIGVFLLILLGVASKGVALLEWGTFSPTMDIQMALLSNDHIQSASAKINKEFSDDDSKMPRTLDVDAVWSGKPANFSDAARVVAATVLSHGLNEATQQDTIQITISYGYDIGISKRSLDQTYEHTPKEWQDIIQNNSQP